MSNDPISPAALAEIRERDVQIDAAWFDITMDEGDKEDRVRRERDSYRDRRNLLAEVDSLQARADALESHIRALQGESGVDAALERIGIPAPTREAGVVVAERKSDDRSNTK